ncbi:response regulator transcription factor [Terrisporobacter vanillatitrophus]|uniref:response regulator transcription factor n=1 Tax=Terrisporobacter vanillatitrophus TaxID=3058402 RepID=UPI00336742EC
MASKILVVDDEKEIRNLIEIYLKNEGYTVLKASNGEEALKVLEKEEIQLMILDVMMPKMDGMEVCRRVREHLNIPIPILMLSAKSEDMDKIAGIMTGADDYLTKPFNPLELSVRVKALLRRAYYFNNMNKEDNIINIETLTIDKNNRTVKVGDTEISFTAREFDILYLLGSNRGRVYSSEEIFTKVWKEEYFGSNNTVMVHMSRIREKLEKYIEGNKIIQTVWGVGYKIEK